MKRIKAKKFPNPRNMDLYVASADEVKKVLDILHIDEDDCTLGVLYEHITTAKEMRQADCYITAKEIRALNYAWKTIHKEN